jgi:hypothetical protein
MRLSISLIFFVNIKNKIVEIIFYSPVGLVNLNDVNSEELVAKSRAYLIDYRLKCDIVGWSLKLTTS